MGVDTPSAPKVDYKQLWKNYSTWSSEQNSRFNRDRGHSEATMARQGLKRGSQAWELNLANLGKQQDKERSSLSKGITASQVKEKMRADMKYMKAQGGSQRPNYRKTATESFNTEMQSAYGDWQYQQHQGDRDNKKLGAGELSKYASGSRKMPTWGKGIQSVDDRVKEMEGKYKSQTEKGQWFETVTETVEKPGSDQDPITTRRTYMTDAGKEEMDRLMNSTDNPFGRKLQDWEAFATLRYGGNIDEAQLSEEQMSAGRAASAASGHRAKASGADAAAEQAATASPWVRKQNYGIL